MNKLAYWSWGAAILGIVLVICGFMAQSSDAHKKCGSGWNWVPVIVGFVMVLAGFLAILQENKAKKLAAGMGAAGAAASPDVSAASTPDLSGGMGGMSGMGGMGGMGGM